MKPKIKSLDRSKAVRSLMIFIAMSVGGVFASPLFAHGGGGTGGGRHVGGGPIGAHIGGGYVAASHVGGGSNYRAGSHLGPAYIGGAPAGHLYPYGNGHPVYSAAYHSGRGYSGTHGYYGSSHGPNYAGYGHSIYPGYGFGYYGVYPAVYGQVLRTSGYDPYSYYYPPYTPPYSVTDYVNGAYPSNDGITTVAANAYAPVYEYSTELGDAARQQLEMSASLQRTLAVRRLLARVELPTQEPSEALPEEAKGTHCRYLAQKCATTFPGQIVQEIAGGSRGEAATLCGLSVK